MPEQFHAKESLRLLFALASRDLRNRYASSYAGVAWNIGVPLLYAIINVVVFSILMSGRMGARYGDVPFSLFYFVPLSLWAFFSDVVIRSTGILREYSYLINKIAFPFWILPLIPIASALLSQGVLLIFIAGLMKYHGLVPASTSGIYILVWLVCILLTVGVAYAISALAVYIPDLSQIVPVGVNILFWLTPILYPSKLVEQGGALWLRSLIMDYNPFFNIVELSRDAIFGTAHISWLALTTTTLVSFLALILGLFVFHKLKPSFADVI
ncbi:ABC transporter permease [Silvimonas iriomotensis]|uniref:Transport permease protein n=1 Tax=Silvimonas iriomotensis TaxID=449662 RepID=A0ABQ2PAW2_9NEIS|nr:ABC transporter permease [Silvimonas iriomotensis]GGP22639.1 transport permease protein [Silvimonas iriomotensis]